MNNHLYKQYESTFILYKENEPIGAYSIGRFKSNTRIGTTGRLAVVKTFQKQDHGGYLVLFDINKLKEKGYAQAEHVFVASKPLSYYHYIKCSSLPQYNRKYLHLHSTPKFFLFRL